MAATVQTPYTQRARYYSSADGFNIMHPRIPAHLFVEERDRVFEQATPTGLVPLDLSRRLQIDFPATSPLILARFARIRAGESLPTRFRASGEIYYVVAGAGETTWGAERIGWDQGDAFVLPGGGAAVHAAGDRDAVLYIVTNEPQLAFERLEPPAPGMAPTEAVHYPGDEIRRHLELIRGLPSAKTVVGKAVSFSSRALDRQRTCLPSFTLAMNSLSPRESQRAHRHNAIAVTLVIQGSRCYSVVDGTRIDWQPWAVMITPPADLHSHHNEGDDLALFLIVQDGGLHYHLRTMGFSYE